MSVESTLVLDDCTSSEDVARSVINGGQREEPFYLMNLDEPYNKVLYFQKKMPRIKIFYAMKSNDHERMLKLMVALGLGFDCASPWEIHKVLQLNVNPLSVIFAIPTKTPSWMKFARDAGVRHTTFDSSYELKKLKTYWPDAKLLIRIRVDGDSIYKLGDKYGCDFHTEAINLLEEAASYNLKVVGVAFHVGSACFSGQSYVIGLQQAKELFDYERRAGRKMDIVDIGGGFMSNGNNNIDQASELINSAVNKLFPDPNVQVIAEPGRYISECSCTLYCSINNVRQVKKNGESVSMIYLNEGLFGSLRYNEPWHVVEKFDAKSKNGDLTKTILWGPTCDSTDRVMENVEISLPKCSPTDWLVFPIQGAYSFGFSSFFSSLPIPQICCTISNQVWMKIKENEVFDSKDFMQNWDTSTLFQSTLPPSSSKSEYFHPTTMLKT